MAWQEWKDTACPSCGNHDDEWWGEDGKEADPPFIVVDRRCLVCKAISEKQKEMGDAEGFDPAGLHLHLKRFNPESDDV